MPNYQNCQEICPPAEITEYIERDKIRESYEKLTRSYVHDDPYIADWRFDEMIESLPAADVGPVRHGRWNRPYISWFLPIKIKNPHCFCTNCAYPMKHKRVTRYCPNCGAMMDLDA